jgi:hypothetical protein
MTTDLLLHADDQIFETETALLKLIEKKNRKNEDMYVKKIGLMRRYLNSKTPDEQ